MPTSRWKSTQGGSSTSSSAASPRWRGARRLRTRIEMKGPVPWRRTPSASVVKLGGTNGCCAVDRLGWVVGAGRAFLAAAGTALPLSGAQAFRRSSRAAGDLVRLAYGDRVAASSARAWLRLGLDLLPAFG